MPKETIHLPITGISSQVENAVCHLYVRSTLLRPRSNWRQRIRLLKTEIVPTSRRPFDARVVRLDFNRLWLQNVEESAPRIKWTVHSPNRTFIRFLTSPDTTPILDGVELLFNQIIHSANGHSYFERSHGPLRWVGMSLPVNDATADPIHNRLPGQVTTNIGSYNAGCARHEQVAAPSGRRNRPHGGQSRSLRHACIGARH